MWSTQVRMTLHQPQSLSPMMSMSHLSTLRRCLDIGVQPHILTMRSTLLVGARHGIAIPSTTPIMDTTTIHGTIGIGTIATAHIMIHGTIQAIDLITTMDTRISIATVITIARIEAAPLLAAVAISPVAQAPLRRLPLVVRSRRVAPPQLRAMLAPLRRALIAVVVVV